MLWESILLALFALSSFKFIKVYFWLKHIDTITSKYFFVPEQPFLGSYFKFNTQEKLLNNLLEFMKKYGNAFKVYAFMCLHGIVIADVKILEFILGRTSIMSKGYTYTFLQRWLGEGILLSTGEKWKKSRKMLTPAFHFQVLEDYVKRFQSSSEILVKKLSQEVGRGSFDVYPYIVLCTLDIICESIMGTKVNAQENASSEYVHAVTEECELACNRAFSLWKILSLPFMLSADFWREKRFLRILHGYTKSVIEKRKQEMSRNKVDDKAISKKRMTLLDLLLKSRVDGQPLTNTEIQEEVDTIMFAGHDTTASAISFTLYCLSKEQDVQKRVMDELNEIFGGDKSRPAASTDFHSMKYLEMVIKETLRLYPSVPMYFRQTDQDTSYKKGTLPPWTQICIFAYGVHRDPKNYPNPEKFDPDRFLPENQAQRNPYSYIPFSAGPRNCIGQKFAMLEMKYIISNILRNFKIHSVPEYDLKLIAVPVLTAKNGIRIKLTERS